MASEQSGFERNGQRRGEEVALDQAEVHDSEEKWKIKAFTRVIILRMEDKRTISRVNDKKIFHNTDQNSELEYRGQSI